MIVTSELRELLHNDGASLVGFGDISALQYAGYTSCVALAVKIPADVVSGIGLGPTRDYFEQYHALNSRLNSQRSTSPGRASGPWPRPPLMWRSLRTSALPCHTRPALPGRASAG